MAIVVKCQKSKLSKKNRLKQPQHKAHREEMDSKELQHNDNDRVQPPLFTHPPEWRDEDRVHFLLAPFPLNTTLSPQDPKITFWSSLILSSSKEINKPSFTEKELQARFKWNQTLVPSCLGAVIQSMERCGTVVKMAEFVQASEKVGWLAWGVKVVSKPVGWALSGYLPSGKYNGEYVLSALIKEYADNVVTEHRKTILYKSTDMVMRENEFVNICLKIVSPEVTRLVELALVQENKVGKQSTELGYSVVKFAPVGDFRKAVAITEVDIGIVRIKEAAKDLTEQVESLIEREQRMRQLAKDNLRLKDKKTALRLLRQSKALGRLLEKRETARDNLQTTLHQIQMAETDVMIYQAYKSSVSALKSLRDSQGPSVEAAEEAVMDLREAIEENEDISGVLSAGDDLGEESEDELERELTDLLEPTTVSAPADETKQSSMAAIERDLEAQLASLTLQDRQSVGPDTHRDQETHRTEQTVRAKQTPLLA